MKKVLRFVVKNVCGVKTWNDFVWFTSLAGLGITFFILMALFHWDFGLLR